MSGSASRSCPVCQASDPQPIHAMTFSLPAESPLPSRYVIATCAQCGMVYADSAACQADYDQYYAQFSKYEDEKTASGGGYSDNDRRRLDVVASFLASHAAPGDRLLDIGCANGGMLEACAAHGFTDLTGVDPSPASIRHVRERGFNGEAMNIAQLSPATLGTFDVIILSHVLEHVFDVSSTLATLRSLLSDRGLLYIEVPDAAGYLTHPAVPFYYFDSEHINHFNRSMLETMAVLHGFSVRVAAEKALVVTDVFSYPAVYVLLEKAVNVFDRKSAQLSTAADRQLANAIRDYVAQCNDNDVNKKISAYADAAVPVIIWGAGSHTQRLLGSTDLPRCNTVAIVDNDSNKHGLLMAGVRVAAPESVRDIPGTILVAAALHADAIRAEIRSMQLPHSVDVLG